MSRGPEQRRDRTRPDVPPPPGLPPAVATAAERRSTVFLVLVAVVVICLAYAGLVGGSGSLWVAAIAGAGAAYMALATARAQLAVGPGWLSCRELFARRWVRTDQLVRVQDQASGVDRVLVLHDRDGRKVGVMLADLRAHGHLADQLLADLRTSVDGGLVLDDRTRERLGL